MIENKNNQSKYLIIGIFILFVAIIIAILTVLALNSNPYKIYLNTFNQFFNNITIPTNNNYKMDMDLNINSQISDVPFNNLDLNLDLYYNKTNKTILTLDSKIDNKEFINIEGINNDQDTYFKLKDIYPKFLKITIPENKVNYDDLNYVLNSLKTAIINSLKEEYFSQETTSIIFEEKEIKVNKNILNLNKDNYLEITKNVINELNNPEFLNKLSILINEDYDTLKQNLEDYYNEIDSSDFTYEDTNIILYTKKYSNEIMQLEIIEGKEKLTISKKDSETFTFELLSEENLNGTIKFKDNEVNITLFYTEIEINLNLKITENIDIPDYDYSDYIDINDISEEDEYNILNKIYEKIIKLGLEMEM